MLGHRCTHFFGLVARQNTRRVPSHTANIAHIHHGQSLMIATLRLPVVTLDDYVFWRLDRDADFAALRHVGY